MKITKVERLKVEYLIGQIYSSVAIPLEPTDLENRKILADLRSKIADLKNYLNERAN